MKYPWIFALFFGFMLFSNPTLVQGLEQKNEISTIETPSIIQPEHITSKFWLITSDESGCSSKNQEAMEFLQSIAFVYFLLYNKQIP